MINAFFEKGGCWFGKEVKILMKKNCVVRWKIYLKIESSCFYKKVDFRFLKIGFLLEPDDFTSDEISEGQRTEIVLIVRWEKDEFHILTFQNKQKKIEETEKSANNWVLS